MPIITEVPPVTDSDGRKVGEKEYQAERPPQWEARAPQQKSSPCSPQPEKARAQQRRPSAAKNKYVN